MTKEELLKLKEELSLLSSEEQKERDKYLKALASGEIQGPPTGYPSIDKPWLKYYENEYIDSDMPLMNSYEYIYSFNKNRLDKSAINYYGNILTFRDLFENINITEKAFREYGIKRGDIVTVSLPNMPESVYIYYALSKIGAISNMIDPRTSKEGIEKYLNEVESKLFIAIDILKGKLNDVKEKTTVEDFIELLI